jgi:Bax protein
MAGMRHGRPNQRPHLSGLVLIPLVMGWGLIPPAGASSPDRASRAAREAQSFPDFSTVSDTRVKKQRFFAFMRPIVEAENARVSAKRARLHELYALHRRCGELPATDHTWLMNLAGEYGLVKFGVDRPRDWAALSARVDIVPAPLALAQAAIESAWGESRFARQGNAVYGQWCYVEGCGIVPKRRAPDARHEVERFKTVNQSVRRYIHNLNTHPAYGELRRLRSEQRRKGEILDGYALAAGLVRYSERREAYVEELRDIIRDNKLAEVSG